MPSSIIACEIPTHKLFRNLTGHKFGRLLVTAFAGKRIRKRGDAVYLLELHLRLRRQHNGNRLEFNKRQHPVLRMS